MQLLDWGVVAGSADAKPAATETPGYPTNGSPPGDPPTVLDAAYIAVLINELAHIVDGFGVSLDRDDDGQISAILSARIKGILGSATDTGSVTTAHLRTVLASTTSQASGAESIVAASDDMLASGANSAALASDGNGTPSAVAALRSLVAACLSCGTSGSGGREAVILGSELSSTSSAARAATIAASLYALITGTRGAVIASEGNSGQSIGVTGTNSATVASLRTVGTTNAGGSQSMVAASEDSNISGGTEAGILAAEDCVITGGAQVAIIASDGSQQRSTGSKSAMIGTTGSFMSACGNAVLLGSGNAEVYNRTNGFGGGYDSRGISFSGADQNLSVWFDMAAKTGKAVNGFSTAAADFAEFMRVPKTTKPGLLMALAPLGDEMVAVPANHGDDVIGITSTRPGFVGNDDDLAPEGETRRMDDPENWCVVGLLGQLPLVVNPTVHVGSYIKPGRDGVGVHSSSRTRVRVLKMLAPGLALAFLH